MKRIVPLLVLVILIVATVLPTYAQGGGNQKGKALTWDDAPHTLPYRHDCDGQVRWGWQKEADVLGPFIENPYQVNDKTTFIVGPSTTDVEAFDLRYVSDYAYFWFQADYDVSQADLKLVGQRFDSEIWQLLNDIYGSSIPTGIDGDPRIHLVHLSNYYQSYAGFFSPDDQCAHAISAESNQRDVLYLMLDYGPVGSQLYLSTVAHELQHLIQFHTDGNEYRWLDEGTSQLLEHLNGFNNDPINNDNVRAFLRQPNHALNSWTQLQGRQAPYYGAGYLFMVYLYERFGFEFIQALVLNPLDGLAAVNNVLETTGQLITLDELVRDWHIANYLDNPYVEDGRYYYSTYSLPSVVSPSELEFHNGEVEYDGLLNQYGAEYFELEAGQYTLNFNGATTVDLVDVAPHSGEDMWWSYNASASITSLTRTVDLTTVEEANLRYEIWWNTNDLPSFLHVLISEDGGLVWEPIEGRRMAKRVSYPEKPEPPSFHYEGGSHQWVEDVINLDNYAGKKIQVRFEYITNNSLAGLGFALDDIQIPELDWFDDVEAEDSGWIVDGFLRTGQTVDQNWSVQLVTNEATPRVIELPVVDGKIQATFDVPTEGGVIIINAAAPLTSNAGEYQLMLQQH